MYLNGMKKYIWSLIAFVFLVGFASCSSKKKTDSTVRGIAKSGEMSASGRVAAASSEDFSLPAIESKFLDKDEQSTRVYLFVSIYKGRKPVSVEEFREKFNLNYVVYSDYGSRDRLGYGNVILDASNTVRSGDRIVVQFDIKKPSNKDSGVVLSEISESGTMKKSLNDLPVRFTNLRISDQLGIFEGNTENLLSRNYVHTGELVSLKSLKKTSLPVFVSFYDHNFEPASSPMNTSPRSTPRSLKVDSTFQITTGNPFSFNREGLYYFTTDTSKAEGIGILVTYDRYPKMTYPKQLIGPVQYMSTNTEIKNIQNADDPKKALDRYWLSLMNGHQDLAKSVIRSFYTRVEEANRLFTTYKEGWKTDKGMIYIILGNPDKVQRSKDREVWVYNQRGNANNINFTFNKRPNQFVDNHYELVRYVEYQPIWYPIVEAWRTGTIR